MTNIGYWRKEIDKDAFMVPTRDQTPTYTPLGYIEKTLVLRPYNSMDRIADSMDGWGMSVKEATNEFDKVSEKLRELAIKEMDID